MRFEDLSENDKAIIRKFTGEENPKGFFCSRREINSFEQPPAPKELTEKEKLVAKLKEMSRPQLIEIDE